MAITATSIFSTTSSVLSVLAQAAGSAATTTTNNEVTLINNQIQKQLDNKIAALEAGPDTAVANATQAQISQLQQQVSTITNTGTQYSANSTVLSEITTQLAALQTAIQNGDSTGFDNALAVATSEVGTLNVVTPTAPFQPDQVVGLKVNGLGIGSSASYDLSTPDGQAAAQSDVNNAQALVGQISQATSNNQIVATDVTTALSTQLNSLVSQQQASDQAANAQVSAEVQTLSAQAQNQEHVIELALGNTQLLSTALIQIETPITAATPFTVLQTAAGTTPVTTSSGSQQSTAGLVSLLA